MKHLRDFLIINIFASAILFVIAGYTYSTFIDTPDGIIHIISPAGSSLAEVKQKLDEEKSAASLRDSAKLYLNLASIYEGSTRNGARIVIFICIFSATMFSISAIAMKRAFKQPAL